MQLSELIQKLNEHIAEYGDIHPVMVNGRELLRVDFEEAITEAAITHPAYLDLVG